MTPEQFLENHPEFSGLVYDVARQKYIVFQSPDPYSNGMTLSDFRTGSSALKDLAQLNALPTYSSNVIFGNVPPEWIEEFKCEKCGNEVDEIELFPLTIEVGEKSEEGWEWFNRVMCNECWDDVRGPLNEMIYGVLGFSRDVRFGGYDFYAEYDRKQGRH
jgi:hypothetical protein